MPVAGDWPTSLNNPNEQLWSVALQLVEAVAFMHERKVAHVDLKPQNVNIPPEGGGLSVIDLASPFERARGPDATYSGVVCIAYCEVVAVQGKCNRAYRCGVLDVRTDPRRR